MLKERIRKVLSERGVEIVVHYVCDADGCECGALVPELSRVTSARSLWRQRG